MKVLVTGHHGYIGSVLAPMLRDAGHDVVGLDTFYYRGCDLAGRPGARARARARRPRRVAARRSRGSTRSSISRRSRTTRSATSTPTGRTRSTSTARWPWLAPRRRRVSRGSSSPRPAACTARRTPTPSSTRTRRCGRSPPYAESKVRAEEGLRELAGRRVLPRVDAERDGVRRLAAPPARHRAQQPRRLGAHDRSDQAPERREVLAPARPHSRTSRRPRSPCSTHLPTRSRATHSTSAPPSRTTGSATSPRSSIDRLPDCEVTFASDASPDPRSYRVDFSKFASRFPDCVFEWTAERGADELAARTSRQGSRSTTSRVTATSASPGSRPCSSRRRSTRISAGRRPEFCSTDYAPTSCAAWS